MCPVYSVNDVTGLYLTPALSQRERESIWLRTGKGRNNSPGFSPLSRATSQIFNPSILRGILNRLRAEARGKKLWFEFALRPSPQPSPKGRGSQSGLGREKVGIIHRALARYQEPRGKSSNHRSCEEFSKDYRVKPASTRGR